MAVSKLERGKQALAEAEAARARVEAAAELRCRTCGRLLLKYDPPIGAVQIPCRRCGTMTDFSTVRGQ